MNPVNALKTFPGLAAMQDWRLPPGTIFVAGNNTVIYPNGAVETWVSIERRMRKQTPPTWKDKPLTEETVTTASPELMALFKRQKMATPMQE